MTSVYQPPNSPPLEGNTSCIYKLGKEAARSGKSKDNNPYSCGELFNVWLRGWNDFFDESLSEVL